MYGTYHRNNANRTLTIDVSGHPEYPVAELIVGCFCELGKHRSVAFVEELARKPWPNEWDVEICHRDVEQSNNKSKNQHHHKQSRRDNQKFVGL